MIFNAESIWSEALFGMGFINPFIWMAQEFGDDIDRIDSRATVFVTRTQKLAGEIQSINIDLRLSDE